MRPLLQVPLLSLCKDVFHLKDLLVSSFTLHILVFWKSVGATGWERVGVSVSVMRLTSNEEEAQTRKEIC